jgi:large subunit ribosomal protein L35
VTGKKKILHNKAYNSHILTKKSPKRKRKLGKQVLVSKADKGNIKAMLPYHF